MMKPGQRRTVLNSPTKPKNSCMLTRDSSPTCFFSTMVYTPYRMALKAAIASPRAISPGVLEGKVLPLPLPLVLLGLSAGDMSTREMRMMPINEAITPMSLRMVKRSTPIRAPKMRVQTPGLGLVFGGEMVMRGGGVHTAC